MFDHRIQRQTIIFPTQTGSGRRGMGKVGEKGVEGREGGGCARGRSNKTNRLLSALRPVRS